MIPRLFLMNVFFFFAILVQSQTVTGATDKKEYIVGEDIEVYYMIDFVSDSITHEFFEGLEILEGPLKTTNYSVKNGVATSSQKLFWRLRALNSGVFKISSPTFFSDSLSFEGEEVVIEVAGEEIIEADKNEVDYLNFIKSSVKPIETQRVIFKNGMAYLERYNGEEWIFIRRLSKKEIKKLSKF